jgi:hypothetical protein
VYFELVESHLRDRSLFPAFHYAKAARFYSVTGRKIALTGRSGNSAREARAAIVGG